MKIEIPNWEEYNPRKDLKSMPWFRVQSDIGYSETLFGLDPDAKWFWIFLLSTCARKMKAEISYNLDYFSFHSGLSRKRVESALQVFESRGLVRITNESDRFTNESVPNITNRTNRTERTEQEAKASSTSLEKSTERGCISAFDADPEIKKILQDVPESTQERWIKVYPDIAWIKTEILKAITWIELNPKKAPKKFGRFMGNWLSRGWEKHRKTIQTNPDSKTRLELLENSGSMTEEERRLCGL